MNTNQGKRMDQERIAELRLHEKHLRASGQMVGACLGECLDALEASQTELAALRGQVGVVVSELMGVPMLQEEFADNGGHSHWNLFDSGTGELIWTEAQEEEWYKHHRRPLSTLPSPRVLRDGIVEVPMEELAVLRDGFGLLRTAWNLSLCGERIGAQAGALIERYDALRAGEAGKGGAT